MRKTKRELFKIAEDKLRGAVMAFQDLELEILEAGEGRASADFTFFEMVESNLCDVQMSIDRYLRQTPHAHSLHVCSCGTTGERL